MDCSIYVISCSLSGNTPSTRIYGMWCIPVLATVHDIPGYDPLIYINMPHLYNRIIAPVTSPGKKVMV